MYLTKFTLNLIFKIYRTLSGSYLYNIPDTYLVLPRNLFEYLPILLYLGFKSNMFPKTRRTRSTLQVEVSQLLSKILPNQWIFNVWQHWAVGQLPYIRIIMLFMYRHFYCHCYEHHIIFSYTIIKCEQRDSQLLLQETRKLFNNTIHMIVRESYLVTFIIY